MVAQQCHIHCSQLMTPSPRLPQVAFEDDGGEVRRKLLALEKKYAKVPKRRVPHPDVGCWWALYDYGLDRVKGWDPAYKHPYPGGWWAVEGVGGGAAGFCWPAALACQTAGHASNRCLTQPIPCLK